MKHPMTPTLEALEARDVPTASITATSVPFRASTGFWEYRPACIVQGTEGNDRIVVTPYYGVMAHVAVYNRDTGTLLASKWLNTTATPDLLLSLDARGGNDEVTNLTLFQANVSLGGAGSTPHRPPELSRGS